MCEPDLLIVLVFVSLRQRNSQTGIFFAVLNGGLVGLALTYAINLMSIFQWGVRQSTEVENQVSLVPFTYPHTNPLVTLSEVCAY